MRSASQLKEYTMSEAEEMGIELDAVREVETEADGTTIRVLETDGDGEADQVGFQVTRPNVDTGRNMFNRRLRNGLRELRSHLNSTGDQSDRNEDTESDPTGSTSSNNAGENPESTSTPTSTSDTTTADPESNTTPTSTSDLGTLSVSVELTDASKSDLVEDFESILEEIEDNTISEQQLDDLNERIDDVDSRLRSLEEQLSMIGSN